jgi:hypothetical protein
MKSSVFISIFNSAWFGLGVLSMFADRADGQGLLAQNQNEDSWGFGQIMALLLMLLPCFAALEIFYGDLSHASANQTEQRRATNSVVYCETTVMEILDIEGKVVPRNDVGVHVGMFSQRDTEERFVFGLAQP